MLRTGRQTLTNGPAHFEMLAVAADEIACSPSGGTGSTAPTEARSVRRWDGIFEIEGGHMVAWCDYCYDQKRREVGEPLATGMQLERTEQ